MKNNFIEVTNNVTKRKILIEKDSILYIEEQEDCCEITCSYNQTYDDTAKFEVSESIDKIKSMLEED